MTLARHMVGKDRPDGPHQIWLQQMTGLPFEQYAFDSVKNIAVQLTDYWTSNEAWPVWMV